MTEDKLNKSIDLKREIDQINNSYTDVCEARRELELNDFRISGGTIEVSIDRRRCDVNLDRLVSFLNKEADVLKEKLETLNKEFKEL